MQLRITGFLILVLSSCHHQAVADSLDNLPSQWQQQLATVVRVDISTLRPDEKKAIAETRAKVETLLVSAKPDVKQLADVYGKLGNLYLTHELYTSADACYNNAIQLNPDHFPWAYYSAYLAQENGNMQAALPRFKKAIELDAEYLPARYRLAQVYLDLNRNDEAYELFYSLLNQPTFKAAAHNGLGQVYLMRQDYSTAVEHFTQALAIAPEATKIHYPLALALRGAGKTKLAKQHLQQHGKHELIINDRLVDALEALKNPATRHFVTAMSAVLKKDYAKAVSEFEMGLEYEADNTAARTSYARVLYLKGNAEQARLQLEQVIAQDPEKSLAFFLLALLDEEASKTGQAAKLYEKVIELDPAHAGAHFFLGNYYLHNKDYRNAISHYESVTLSNEKNIPAQIFRLIAMMGNGNPDRELLAVTQQITDRAPNLVSIKRIQILILALSNDASVRNSKQAQAFAELIYKRGEYPVNLELLALTTAATGDFDLATDQNHP